MCVSGLYCALNMTIGDHSHALHRVATVKDIAEAVLTGMGRTCSWSAQIASRDPKLGYSDSKAPGALVEAGP